MNQPSLRRGLLTATLLSALKSALRDRCTVLGPVGVYCEETDEGFGPDLVVLCEPPRLDCVRGRALVNPRAIIEILSPSTETIDKGDKLHSYRTLASLHEYVLVSQEKRFVQVYRRGRDGWLWQDSTAGSFELCDAAVSLDDVYEGLESLPLVR
jgi:Uma2 family endonuclease